MKRWLSFEPIFEENTESSKSCRNPYCKQLPWHVTDSLRSTFSWTQFCWNILFSYPPISELSWANVPGTWTRLNYSHISFFFSVETYLTYNIIEFPCIFEYQPVTIWVLFNVADDIWGEKNFFTKILSRNNYTDSSSCYLLHLWSFIYNWRRIYCNKTSMNPRLPWFELKSSSIHSRLSCFNILLPAEHSARSRSCMAVWFIVLTTLCVLLSPWKHVHNDLLSEIFNPLEISLGNSYLRVFLYACAN